MQVGIEQLLSALIPLFSAPTLSKQVAKRVFVVTGRYQPILSTDLFLDSKAGFSKKITLKLAKYIMEHVTVYLNSKQT